MRTTFLSVVNVQTTCAATLRRVVDQVPNCIRVFSDEVYERSAIVVHGEECSLVEYVQRIARVVVDSPTALSSLSGNEFAHNHAGLVDIIPISPLEPTPDSLKTAERMASRVGSWIGANLDIPVFMYNDGNLPNVRKMKTSFFFNSKRDSQPDFGPSTGDSQFGCTLVGGCRYTLNHNVRLATELSVARTVAKAIRESSKQPTSLHGVDTMAFQYRDPAVVEVACNLRNSQLVDGAAVSRAIAALAPALYSYQTTPTYDELGRLVSWDHQQCEWRMPPESLARADDLPWKEVDKLFYDC